MIVSTIIFVLEVSRAAYRLWLHPLSSFPGPVRAAVSNAWLYELSKCGEQEQEFEKLHIAYGTHAIRIGPNELHLSDTSLYSKIYRQRTPYTKQENFYHGFGIPNAAFSQVDFALHRKRRQHLNPFFSKAGISKLESSIQEHVIRLRRKITALVQQGKPIFGNNAFRCVTVDIISQFAFARSRYLVQNSDETFMADYLQTLDAVLQILWDSVYSPVVRWAGLLLPKAFAPTINEPLSRISALVNNAAESVYAYKASPSHTIHPVILDALKDLPHEDVVEEAVDLLVAGSDTTALTLTYGVWHISNDRDIKSKLTKALDNALSDTDDKLPTLVELESIPYLVACVKESFRMAMPVPGRLPRIVPAGLPDPLIVDGKTVPSGTTVGMSAYTMHFNEDLWGTDARVFNPDRWLGEKAKSLEAHLVTFSKGDRSCIGQNLAQAEALSVLAMLYRHFDIEIDAKMNDKIVAKDNFTRTVAEPGLLLEMSCR